ncbi:MAG: trypsin-like peptidase domain-containing protein [Anaerolineae bacterium]|nr:trypsin-like peptidase domain-containing protein [Anaerolineae bacterium]
MNILSGDRLRWAGIVLAILTLFSLACSVSLLEPSGGSVSSEGSGSVANVPTALPAEILQQADAEELLLTNIYQRVNPSVVNIDVSTTDLQGELADLGSGSGFVYDTEGHIVTNYHVVADVDALRVTMSDGVVFEAKVVGTDDYGDLAVLKIDVPPGYQLIPVELGDSKSLQVGQRVIAIGNPFGLAGSMSVGIVSGIGRTLPSEVISGDGSGQFSNPLIIQTDAAINPGNSGGPLLDSNGQVIGINVAIRSSTGLNSGIGFAIPVDTVKRIVPQIIEKGKVDYPYLGISSNANFTLAELAIEFDLPVSQGVLIDAVAKGSGADKAGLLGGDREETFRGIKINLGGDIIIAMDDFPINNFDELLGYIVTNTSVGQTVDITIVRDGKEMVVPVTLGSRSD